MKTVLVTVLLLLFSAAVALAAALNINTATESQLEALSGIGPAKAQAIIEYRKSHGEFKSVDELVNVSGIGAKTLEKLHDDITVEK